MALDTQCPLTEERHMNTLLVLVSGFVVTHAIDITMALWATCAVGFTALALGAGKAAEGENVGTPQR